MPFKTSPQLGGFNLLSTSHLFSHRVLSVSVHLLLCCPCCPPASGGCFCRGRRCSAHLGFTRHGWGKPQFPEGARVKMEQRWCKPCRRWGHGFGLVNHDFRSRGGLILVNKRVILCPSCHGDVVLGIRLIQGWESRDSGDLAVILHSPTSPLCTAFDKLLLFSSCCLVRVLYAPNSLFKWHPFTRRLQEDGFHLCSLLLLQGYWLLLIKTFLKVQ